MTLTVEIVWILAVSLVALRLGTVFVLTPLLGADIPARFRVLFVLALSAVMVSGLSLSPASLPTSTNGLVLAALSEVALGAILAFGVFACFGVFLLAGRLMDVQLGLSIATLIDPTNRMHAPLLGTFLNLLAVALFFLVDGHHMLLRGFIFSLEQVPPGTFVTNLDPGVVVAQFGTMFVYAVALSAPVLFTLLLVDVVLALIARTMPQVNVFIVSLPLKILIGLLILAVSLRFMTPLLTRIFENLFDYWHQVLS